MGFFLPNFLWVSNMWLQKSIYLSKKVKGVHLITDELLSQLPEIDNLDMGVAYFFLKHTSAGLTINENADKTVRTDFHEYIQRLVPDDLDYFEHILEGSDDMPAHIKSSLFGCHVTIPVANGRLNMGIWQGIYLGEFRNHGGAREILVTLHGLP